jgi:Tol biopolymer transport system component
MFRTAALLLAGALALLAQTPTIDQSLSMKSVGGAQISPDGRYVAYTVQEANWDDNEFVTQIWIAVAATGERYQLTSGKKGSSGPQWAPDSRRLAFTSDRDGKRQIYVISPAGGEAAQLTAEENGVGSMAWSPEGDAIAYTSTGPESKARKDRKEKYGEIDIIGGDYVMNHLWRVAVPAEIPSDTKKLPKPEALTTGESFNVTGFSWAPDGKRIAFSTTRDPDLGSQDTEQISILDLSDLHVRKLT